MRTLLSTLLLIAVGCSSSEPGGGGGSPPAAGAGGRGGGAPAGQSGGSGGSAGAAPVAGSGGSTPGTAGSGGGGGRAVDAGGGDRVGSSRDAAGRADAGGGGRADAGPSRADAGGGAADAAPASAAFVFAAGAEFGGASISAFALDLGTGALSRRGGGIAAGPSPDYVAVHPGGRFLFVNNEVGAGRATAFSIAPSGTLTMLNSAASGGGGPAHIWVHSSGKWLLSANYNDGRLGITAIGDDGRLTATSSAAAGGQAHMALDDGVSGNFVFVPCAAAGHVAMFRFDVATGRASANTPATVASAGRPRHMAFHPGGKWAYVTHESRNVLTTFAYDATTGLLSAPRDVGAPQDGAHVLAHPSGNFVFHIARGGGAVTVYRVASDGALTQASRVGSGGYDATITRDGKYLIVVSGSAVRSYAVNADTGALSPAGNGQAANNSQSVAVATF
jgi:6-phosphogluconolactonase